MEEKIKSFEEFYPYYLTEHKNRISRLLHFIGTTIVFLLFIGSLLFHSWEMFVAIPFAGYGFAWVGHFFFEKNKPATFKYPMWSLASDFKLYFELWSGKQKF